MNLSDSLRTGVRTLFYPLYENVQFRRYLASVGNADSLTGNRMFDRYMAVTMIKEMAKEKDNQAVLNAKEVEIYFCLLDILRTHGMGLKLRRAQRRGFE